MATLVAQAQSPQVVFEAVTREIQQHGGPVRVDRFGQDSGAIAREAWRRLWLLRIPPPPQFERPPGDDLRPIPRPTGGWVLALPTATALGTRLQGAAPVPVTASGVVGMIPHRADLWDGPRDASRRLQAPDVWNRWPITEPIPSAPRPITSILRGNWSASHPPASPPTTSVTAD
jgi:hypothetical protein